MLKTTFFYVQVQESWVVNGNITCYLNPTGVKLELYPATAIAGKTFPVLLRNQQISTGLEPVLCKTEKS